MREGWDNFLRHVPNRKNQNLMLPLRASYQKVSRTFVFEDERTSQARIVDLALDVPGDHVDLAAILAAHTPLASRLALYDPAANAFLPLRTLAPSTSLVPRRLVEPSFVLVRFCERERAVSSGSESQFEGGGGRQSRSRERTVGEALQLVRQWRGLHLSHPKPSNARKKVNLQEAARMLGVSKKSLDDYYCQLRLAEQFGFDFDRHLHHKMGTLRSFVKDRKADDQRNALRPHRHPKNLRIIEDTELEARLLAHLARKADPPALPSHGPQSNHDSASVRAPSEPVRSTAEVGSGGNSQGLMEINALECEFYRGFEFVLDDPCDPFLALNNNFSKRLLEDESDAILFL